MSKKGAQLHCSAIEAFVRGFACTRSFTHPYLGEKIGPFWLMRDAPRKSGDYRNEEWVSFQQPAKEVDRVARKHTRGRFVICAFLSADEPIEPTRDEFKSLGYRFGHRETFMIHTLKEIPSVDSPADVRRVTTADLADRINKAARYRQVLPEHFRKDSPLRQYAALIDDKPVGWVRSIVAGESTWVSNMYVVPKFRRRGIGKAMLCDMLRDDRAAGAKMSVLLASTAGAMLYPRVGYEKIGMLLLFTPKRK